MVAWGAFTGFRGGQILVGRFVSHLRHQVVAAPFLDQLRDLGFGIGEIAEVAGVDRAGDHAGRLPFDLFQVLVIDTIDAERTFLHHALVGVELAGSVGAGPGAQFASDAQVFIDENDARRCRSMSCRLIRRATCSSRS